MDVMSFETERLVLREFELSDWDAMHRIAAHPEVARFMDWKPAQERDTRDYIRQALADRFEDPRPSYRLAVVRRQDDQLIGACWLHVASFDNREASIGYVIGPEQWGQGYATETGRGLLAFGFEELRLHRIYAECDPANKASIKVLEKLGMRQEGHLREHLLAHGEWHDSLIYSMLDHEYAVRQAIHTA